MNGERATDLAQDEVPGGSCHAVLGVAVAVARSSVLRPCTLSTLAAAAVAVAVAAADVAVAAAASACCAGVDGNGSDLEVCFG